MILVRNFNLFLVSWRSTKEYMNKHFLIVCDDIHHKNLFKKYIDGPNRFNHTKFVKKVLFILFPNNIENMSFTVGEMLFSSIEYLCTIDNSYRF